MSTPTTRPPRALFSGLIDDAAVFPPGNAPLAEAISRRSARRRQHYADLVGPLLLPPALVAEALADASALTISVVGRPDVPLADVLDAAAQVVASPAHSLAGVEVGWSPSWRQALDLGVPVAVEVSPGQIHEGVNDLAGETSEQVRAKLRTGSTPASPVPTPAELSTFVVACVNARVGFKLTGGLHHAVSLDAATVSGSEAQFGFLNVLLATDQALRGGTAARLEGLLQQRDSDLIVRQIRELDDERARAVRDVFHSYGCCDVLDPIGDLSRLHLIEETL